MKHQGDEDDEGKEEKKEEETRSLLRRFNSLRVVLPNAKDDRRSTWRTRVKSFRRMESMSDRPHSKSLMTVLAVLLLSLFFLGYLPTWRSLEHCTSQYRVKIPLCTVKEAGKSGSGTKAMSMADLRRLQEDIPRWHTRMLGVHSEVSSKLRFMRAATTDGNMDVDFGDAIDNMFRQGEETGSLTLVIKALRLGEGWFTVFLILHIVLALLARRSANTGFLLFAVITQLLIMHLVLKASLLNASLETSVLAVERCQLSILNVIPSSSKEHQALSLCMSKLSVVRAYWSRVRFDIKLLVPSTWRILCVDPGFLTEANISAAGTLLYFLLQSNQRNEGGRKLLWTLLIVVTMVVMAMLVD